MIEFHVPELSDKRWVDPLLRLYAGRACDYNFSNLFMWGPVFGVRIALLSGRLAIQVRHPAPHAYLWPVGSGDLRTALLALEADAAAWDMPFRLVAVTERHKQQLDALFPGQFRYQDERADYDYLYEINRLADLPGKKLHAKRNHVNRFLKEYSDWVYEEMTPRHIPECLVMDEQWYLRNSVGDGADIQRETNSEGLAFRRALNHFDELGLEGGLLRVYGEVVAFTVGSILDADTFDVHYEKAYGELPGAYAMINRCFARQVRDKHPGVVFLNRENDLGIEGLRKAKLSYDPDMLVAKYSAVKIRD